MTIETVTFALAMAGFVALTTNSALTANGRTIGWIASLAAVLVVSHVALVWAFRYEWSFAQATRNGYAGFLIFHVALLLIFLTPFQKRFRVWFTVAAFLVVCLGANGAVFRYDVVAIYRVPVIACTALGVAAVARGLWKRR